MIFVQHVGVFRIAQQGDDVQEQIAQFLAQVGVVRLLNGLNHLVALLDQSGAQALVRLLAIPRTPVRRAQPGHNFLEPRDVAHSRQSELLTAPNSLTSSEDLRET